MKGDMKGDVNVVRFFRGSCDGGKGPSPPR